MALITVRVDDIVFTVYEDETVGIEVVGHENVITVQELNNLLNVSSLMARQKSQ